MIKIIYGNDGDQIVVLDNGDGTYNVETLFMGGYLCVFCTYDLKKALQRAIELEEVC